MVVFLWWCVCGVFVMVFCGVFLRFCGGVLRWCFCADVLCGILLWCFCGVFVVVFFVVVFL